MVDFYFGCVWAVGTFYSVYADYSRYPTFLPSEIVVDGVARLLDCDSPGPPPGPRWLSRSPTWRLLSRGSWTFLCGPGPGAGPQPPPGSSEGFWPFLSRTWGDHSNHTNYSRGNEIENISRRKTKLKSPVRCFPLVWLSVLVWDWVRPTLSMPGASHHLIFLRRKPAMQFLSFISLPRRQMMTSRR